MVAGLKVLRQNNENNSPANQLWYVVAENFQQITAVEFDLKHISDIELVLLISTCLSFVGWHRSCLPSWRMYTGYLCGLLAIERAWSRDHATSLVTAVLPLPGQRCGTVCVNSFSNQTSPSDNSNDRWERLCLVSWAAAPCVWTLRALTRNLLTYLFTYLLTYYTAQSMFTSTNLQYWLCQMHHTNLSWQHGQQFQVLRRTWCRSCSVSTNTQQRPSQKCTIKKLKTEISGILTKYLNI